MIAKQGLLPFTMQKRKDAKKIEMQAKSELQKLANNSDAITGYSGQDFSRNVKNDEDKVEYWGKKIGRGLGFLFVMYLIYEIITLMQYR